MAKKKTKGRASRPRRGKSESVTGAKAGQVEVRAALSQGDLQLPAVDDYNHHKKNIAGCLDSLESAKSRYRKALQSAQSAGIDTNAMLEARRIVRENDPKKTANRLNQLAFALEQEGFSIHFTVHDTLAGDQEDLVARRFFEDGKAGRTFDCRYPENSDLAQIAKDNWMKGQAELLGVGGSEPAHDLKSPPGLSDDQHVTH